MKIDEVIRGRNYSCVLQLDRMTLARNFEIIYIDIM